MMTRLGYAGPAAPSVGGVLASWHLDAAMLAVLLLVSAAYIAGVVRLRRAGRPWPPARTAAFLGLGVVAGAVCSLGWPEVYAPVLFSVYATQVMALLLIVPFLMALGRPIGLADAALGEAGRRRLRAVLDSGWARFFTVPMISPFLLAAIPALIFFTPLYRASLTSAGVLSLLHVLLLLIGLAVLLPLWESDTVGARIAYVILLLFAFIELLADAVPGIVIRLQTHVIAAGYFAALGRPWGSSPLHDQQLGGDILWGLGEAIDVPFLAVLLVQWVRADRREAAHVDQMLDAVAAAHRDPDATTDARLARAAGSQAATSATDDNDAALPAGGTRPWWETDASVFGDRAKDYERPRRGSTQRDWPPAG